MAAWSVRGVPKMICRALSHACEHIRVLYDAGIVNMEYFNKVTFDFRRE
jgi:hypothetical protein